MTITPAEIEALTSWSDPREINTKRGPRMLRKATPTDAFSATWTARKDELKAAGVNFSKNQYTNKWELAWWSEIDPAEEERRRVAVAASRQVAAVADLPRPAGLNYLPFQVAGILTLLDRKHALLADQMGLGKTVQAAGLINVDETIDTVLVVCPKTLKINWRMELKRWLVRPLTVGVVDKTWPAADIVIINYEMLEKWRPFIMAREWGMLLLDEAHYIKNDDTLRSAYIKGRKAKPEQKATANRKAKPALPALAPIRARRHLRLTGTPIVNRPRELQNLVDDLDSRFAGFGFLKTYCAAFQKRAGKRMVWDFSGASNLDQLQRQLRETIMVRRLKAEVLTDLPPKRRQVIELEPETLDQERVTNDEREYESRDGARLANLRAAVELAKAEGETEYAAAVQRLREALEVSFTEMSKLRHDTAVAKLPLVIEKLAEVLEDSDEKIIVGAHHHDVIDGLRAAAAARGWAPVTLTGRETTAERQAAVEAFQTDPTVRLFIGSIQAAGVGITLTAGSTVVFAELDWVPGNVSQFEDRAHRIGQTDSVLVWHLVLAGSIDARMARLLVEKQEVIDAALDTNHPDRATSQPAAAAALEERAKPMYALPIAREEAATVETRPANLAREAAALEPAKVAAIHRALRLLAGLDDDHALKRNGEGYNQADTHIGHSLADRFSLTPKQAALGLKLARKYRRQLPAEIIDLLDLAPKEAAHA